MKTFTKIAAQGDFIIFKIDEIPVDVETFSKVKTESILSPILRLVITMSWKWIGLKHSSPRKPRMKTFIDCSSM
jgi:hypothetical protein